MKKPRRKQYAVKRYGNWSPELVEKFNSLQQEEVQKGADKLVSEYMEKWGYIEKVQVQQQVLKTLQQLKKNMEGKRSGQPDSERNKGIEECVKCVERRIKKENTNNKNTNNKNK